MADVAGEDLAARMQRALEVSDVGEWLWTAETDVVELSDIACRVFGLEAGSTLTWREMQASLLHDADAPAAAAAVQRAVQDGSQYTIEYRCRRPDDGREVWIGARGRAAYDAAGQVIGMNGVVTDVTWRKAAELAVAEEAKALEILNRTGALVAQELNLEMCVQAVTDAGVEVTGAQFGAFFYNVIDDEGEAYTLYTLSGAPREAFSKFPMPRNTPIFAPTFEGTAVVRSPDILADPRYGQMDTYGGMPPGHLPVRSYLAVPVISRLGEVLGGLFFGHERTNAFQARDERVMVGIAAQAAIAIDNARLYQKAQREIEERQKAEAALTALANELETRVAARTAELEAANLRLKTEIAERERAEEALRQAQKMEAVGQLTGGVAHDFNNLLTVVIGNLDTLKRRLGDDVDPRASRAINHALEGSRRAASLTQRLLAFARRAPLDPKAVDPNRLVRGMGDLFFRTLGESIEVETVLTAGVWPIEVDVGQLESALLNLAVNARDAMPGGGKLTVETSNVHVDETYAKSHGVTVGQYVCICVSDTGLGMDKETIEKAFEPFFTTKPTGHGTGLGLSQVYGFVRQSGGHVRIYSEPGEGVSVRLYLPRFRGKVAAETQAVAMLARGDAGETVLVVEDEAAVRALSVSLMEELGYQALEAGDAFQALDVLDAHPEIDLLFTDVGLPKMNGRQLADEARRRRPELKVLFTTGYAKNAIVHQGRLDPGVDLLGKPFTFAELSEKLRNMLDRKG